MSTKKNIRRPKVSLVIPVYNETVRLISGLSQIIAYLQKKRYSWELIIVDDGSHAPVVDVITRAVKKKLLVSSFFRLPILIIRLPRNMGKGAAISSGVERAKGEVVVFTDIDLSVPIETLDVMRQELTRAPMVVASRRLPQSHILVHQSLIRETAGRIFTWVSNVICDTTVTDITCGFKGFTRDTAHALFGLRRIDRWVFDSEIVFLARKYHVAIREIPVSWSNKSGSKVRPYDSVQSFVDLFRVRWNDMRGEYGVRAKIGK